jgi:hypothetical protein
VPIDGIWYYAPSTDLAGNTRPYAIYSYPDMGALESDFNPVPLSWADLAALFIPGGSLTPGFHKDTLSYAAFVIDTFTAYPVVRVIPKDPVARVEIQEPEDIRSPDPAKRTATITVTSSDETNEKIYRLELNLLSAVNTLSSLEVEGYSLDPPFDPDILVYYVEIPDTTTIHPGITAIATHENAEIKIDSASLPDNLITKISVTPEAGISFYNVYMIAFNLRGVNISEWESDNFVKLFPNPVTDVLTVQPNKPCRAQIKITSLSGQQVYSSEMEGTSINLDLSSLQKGIYLITIRSKDFVTTRKFIKL